MWCSELPRWATEHLNLVRPLYVVTTTSHDATLVTQQHCIASLGRVDHGEDGETEEHVVGTCESDAHNRQAQ